MAALFRGENRVKELLTPCAMESSGTNQFLDLSDLLLDLPFGVFSSAVGLQTGFSDRLARYFLNAAGDVFGGALYYVMSAGFHVSDFDCLE
jgi:hypothetical protein